VAPIKGISNLFTDMFRQRLAAGNAAEQAALRRLETMVSAAAMGRGVDGVRSHETDGQYQVQPLNPDAAAGAAIQFGDESGVDHARGSDSLLTRAGQILFNESLYQGDGASFDPREELVTGLGSEMLQAHRASTSSRVELAERVQDALQEAIDSPGQGSELVDDPSAGTQLSWLAPETGSSAVYQQERLEDLVTEQGREMLTGQPTAAAAVPDRAATGTGEELVPDDLVTEHFRRFHDAAHSEASAMAEIEGLIVSAAFGQEVDWQNSSHLHGQGPDMTVSFQTGVNEAGETTFTSLKVVDLVDESVAESLGITATSNSTADARDDAAEVTVATASAEREQASQVSVDPNPTTTFDPTVTDGPAPDQTPKDVSEDIADPENPDLTGSSRADSESLDTPAETAAPANSVDVSTLFTEGFSAARDDAVAHGSGGAMYRSAVQDLEDLVTTAASGQGVTLEESEPWTAEEEPEPFGMDHRDLRAEGEGIRMSFWQLDGMDGVVDSREMLNPQGQAVLSAALDAGEGETFNPQMIVRGVELETNGWGTGEQPSFDTPSLEDLMSAEASQLPDGPIGRWTQAAHDIQAETGPTVGAGAHEID
jgi:hypothetical protein